MANLKNYSSRVNAGSPLRVRGRVFTCSNGSLPPGPRHTTGALFPPWAALTYQVEVQV